MANNNIQNGESGDRNSNFSDEDSRSQSGGAADSRDAFYRATAAASFGATADRLIGEILDGRYRIERNLADGSADSHVAVADKGGIGVVYLAKDLKNVARPVVVKVLRSEVVESNPDVLRKFQHEREALVKFDHPGIVALLDSGVLPDNNPYLVMPFIKGRSLRAAINAARAKRELPDLAFCADVIEAVTDALAAAHHEQILHRDIKPENVMLTTLPNNKERIRLIDFGVARVVNSQIAAVTQNIQISGTLLYVSPEQLRGDVRQTQAVDVYSCGVMFYELLTGARPFEARNLIEMSEMQRRGVQIVPSRRRQSLTARVDRLLMHSLEYEAQNRPADIARFGRELATALREIRETEVALPLSPVAAAAAAPTQFDSLATHFIQPADATADAPVAPQNYQPLRKSNQTAYLLIGLLILGATIGAAALAAGGLAMWNANLPTTLQQNLELGGVEFEKPVLTDSQQVLLALGSEIKWAEREMTWRVPAGYRVSSRDRNSLSLMSLNDGFMHVQLAPVDQDFPIAASLKANYQSAVTQMKNGEVEAVRRVEIDGVPGVEFIEAAKDDSDAPRRHIWIGFRKYPELTQMVNILFSAKNSNFNRRRNEFAAILYSAKIAPGSSPLIKNPVADSK